MKDIIYVIYNYILRIFYCLLCLAPVKHNAVFVNNFDGKGVGDSVKYIVKSILEKNGSVRIYWLGIENCSEFVDGHEYIFIKKKSLKAMFIMATSRVWLSNVRMPLYTVKRKSQFYINTWHGTVGFKKAENECPDALSKRYIVKAKHDSKMIDFWISACSDQTETYRKYYWYEGDGIWEIGYPRIDILIRNEASVISELKKKFGYDESHYVLYAPTFRKDYGLSAYDMDYDRVLDGLELKFGGKWKMIMRLHPNMADNMQDIVSESSRIVDGCNCKDIQELMLVSDALITDYSSTGFDYMFTKKPVFLYASDIDEYRKDRDFHIEFEDTPFPVARNNEEMLDIIDSYDCDKYLAELDKFMKKLGYVENPDSSSDVADRVLEEIER